MLVWPCDMPRARHPRDFRTGEKSQIERPPVERAFDRRYARPRLGSKPRYRIWGRSGLTETISRRFAIRRRSAIKSRVSPVGLTCHCPLKASDTAPLCLQLLSSRAFKNPCLFVVPLFRLHGKQLIPADEGSGLITPGIALSRPVHKLPPAA